MVNTKHRSKEVEIMDDLDMSGDLLISSLDQLAKVNKWLGGNKITIDGLKKILVNHPKEKTISIVDLGCGNGDMLRKVAEFGRKNGNKFQLLGIDANQATIDYANKLSADFPELTFSKEDVLGDQFEAHKYDIAMCTLFLHHFEDEVALKLVQTLVKNSTIGVLINDLHRHKMAYILFNIITSGIKNKMTQEDGLTSILKAFKREDLERFSKEINYKSTITWRWAFRFQWIIKKS
ncbi:methyltransferase domain-containing protein [Brumimicrobium mesophilum]|uniref:methyltransferase domain-containing protein n=1 Tax=Brumimicrobium mesophilum TaxID=392717 RepID=UPI000D13F39A|nr:methyltransferase domain-containing protein [Brumimicrobium mesophilum]